MVIRWRDGIQGLEIFYCLPWAMGSGMLLSAQFISLTIWSLPEQMARATAVYYLSQQIGLVFGTSVSAAALQRLFGYQLWLNLVDFQDPKKTKVLHSSAELCLLILIQSLKIINHLLGDFGFISNLPQSIQAAVQVSFIEAWRLIPGELALLDFHAIFRFHFLTSTSSLSDTHPLCCDSDCLFKGEGQ